MIQKHLKYNLIYHRRLIKRFTGHKKGVGHGDKT